MHTHPGRRFIEQFGTVDGPESLKQYATFLREESGISVAPPVNLATIFERFGIPIPRRAPLPGQQGLLLDSELGLILIEERDRETRQRFTEAHELMELLFAAIPVRSGANARDVGGFRHKTKERLCNAGAAELLMPIASYLPRVIELGVSFATGRVLSVEYDVSLSAALVHMAKIGPGRHAVTLWRMKNKPTEIQNQITDAQLKLMDISPKNIAPKRLRVEWSLAGTGVPYIPTDKSIPDDSFVYLAWRNKVFTAGTDRLELGTVRGVFYSENLPFEVEGETQVLSLLHLPNDVDCGRGL